MRRIALLSLAAAAALMAGCRYSEYHIDRNRGPHIERQTHDPVAPPAPPSRPVHYHPDYGYRY